MKKQSKRPSKKAAAPFITDERARKILADYAEQLANEYAYTETLLFGDAPTDRAIRLVIDKVPTNFAITSRDFADVRGSLLLCGLHEVCDELQRRHDARSAEWRQFVTAAGQAPQEAKEAERKALYPAGLEEHGNQYEAFWTALETFQRGISADYAFIIVDLLGTKQPQPTKRTSPLYPTDEQAKEILAEGVKRRKRDKHKAASWRDIALSLLEQERKNGTRPYYPRMMNMKPDNCVILPSNNERVNKAAENWGKYISYYANRGPK